MDRLVRFGKDVVKNVKPLKLLYSVFYKLRRYLGPHSSY
jgi:hypothetical protein